jgi:hypothetical protein
MSLCRTQAEAHLRGGGTTELDVEAHKDREQGVHELSDLHERHQPPRSHDRFQPPAHGQPLMSNGRLNQTTGSEGVAYRAMPKLCAASVSVTS